MVWPCALLALVWVFGFSFIRLAPNLVLMEYGILASVVGGLTVVALIVVAAKKMLQSFKNQDASAWSIMGYAFYFYLNIIGLFSLVYRILSLMNGNAFKPHDLSLFDAVYFSIVCLSTVGFGDIIPVDVFAKVAVCIEIIVSVFTNIIILSSCSAYIFFKIQEDQ